MKKTAITDPRKDLVKFFEHGIGHRHSWDVFADFCQLAATSMANSVDLRPCREKREADYLQIAGQYTPEQMTAFSVALAKLVDSLEMGFDDVLGRTFHQLELHNKWVGQYFTPYPLCQGIAQLTFDADSTRQVIAKRGFITVSEPASGSGAMVIALAEAMFNQGINFQQHCHVTAVDVDFRCVMMTYLQLSLLGVPAVVVHGNTLTLEEWSHWYTPVHIVGGWNARLRGQRSMPDVFRSLLALEMTEPGEGKAEPENDEPAVIQVGRNGQLLMF